MLMRIFTAIVLPEKFSEELYTSREELRMTSGRCRWIQPENFHITLQFMGELTPKEAEDVSLLLEVCATRSKAFSIKTSGPGQFPSKGNPRLIFEGLDTESATRCKEINNRLRRMLTEECFALEKRKYHPHISLCRVPANAFPMLEGNSAVTLELQECNIEELAIYRSNLGPQGAHYDKLASFPLGSP